MKIIRISGIIARWEMESESNVTPETLQKALDEANGQPVRIDINSPGGNVAEGLEMFNMIKNYSGHTETRIVSMAASMGSIIALAGKKRTAEKTASYMIHNVSGAMWGDYRDLRKYADRLENMTAHLSTIYTDLAGIDNNEVLQMMNDETWRYGDQLSEFGFDIVDSEDETNFETAKFNSHNRYDNYVAEMKARPEEFAKDIEKAVACIGGLNKPKEANTVKNPASNSGNNINKEIASMTEDQLRKEFPDVYNSIIQKGAKMNQDLVTAHITMGEAGNCMELAVKNIKAGNEINHTIQAEYMAEGMKSRDLQNRNDDEAEDLGDGEDDSEADETAQAEYEAELKNKMGAK